MNIKHTPTPWHLEDYGWSRTSDDGKTPKFSGRIAATNVKPEKHSHKSQVGFTIHSGAAFGLFGRTIEECEANAAFIVRACNGWNDREALLSRIKELEADNASL